MSVRARTLAPLVLALTLAGLPAAAGAATHATQIGSFDQPVAVAAPPDGPHRLFVVEKPGYLRVVRDGVTLPEPFLDIHTEVRGNGEQGFLSIAFAPDYRVSGRLYLYYTVPSRRPGDAGSDIVVEEVARSADPDRADPATRRRLLAIPHPTFANHVGGQLIFGPDGYLWITTGDGGSGDDPANNAQNLDSLLGKVLRIDPRGGDPYAIPADNPFAAPGDGARDEIWAFGLRNPFRASFDRATGDLAIGDVGQGAVEEVDFAPRGTGAGANYGWSCFEGSQPNPSGSGPCAPDPVAPVLEQNHSTSGFCAIIGGVVVRDPALGDLAGRYVYGDNCATSLRSAVLAKPLATDDRPAGVDNIAALSSLGEDSCGHVYATGLGGGGLYRLDGDQPFAPCPDPAGSPSPVASVGPGPDAARGDSRAPLLTLSRARIQRALRHRGFIVAVRCDEACDVAASGRLRVRGDTRTFVLRPVSRRLAAGARSRFRTRMSGRALGALRRALPLGRRATAGIVARGSDAAGNEARSRKSVQAR
jgi:glucose/arabinose dehydrogenase